MSIASMILIASISSSTPILKISSETQPIVQTATSADCCSPTFDPASRRWVVPLQYWPEQGYVAAYSVEQGRSSPETVAIQLVFPRDVRLPQEVYLSKPSIRDATEGTVRRLWENQRITGSASDLEVQFQGLQDYGFLLREIRDSDPAPDSAPTVSARGQRAAFLFSRAVANLAQKSWFVVDDDHLVSLNYALALLEASQRANKCWLGKATCAGLDSLINEVNYAREFQLGGMYRLISPRPGTGLSIEFCESNLSSMHSFFEHFMRSLDQARAQEIRRNSGLSEARISSEIAACVVDLTKCGSTRIRDPLLELERAEKALERSLHADTDGLAGRHMEALNDLQDALSRGLPLTCSST